MTVYEINIMLPIQNAPRAFCLYPGPAAVLRQGSKRRRCIEGVKGRVYTPLEMKLFIKAWRSLTFQKSIIDHPRATLHNNAL